MINLTVTAWRYGGQKKNANTAQQNLQYLKMQSDTVEAVDIIQGLLAASVRDLQLYTMPQFCLISFVNVILFQ